MTLVRFAKGRLSSTLIALYGIAAWGSMLVTHQQDAHPPAPRALIAIPSGQAVDATPSGCAECHSEVTKEWALGAHGLAWLDLDYQQAIKKKQRPKSCHACHIPAPLLSGGELSSRVTARKTDLHLGVSCESCHLGADQTLLGPRGEENQAHASSLSEFMSAPGSNRLCSICHDKSVGPVIGIADDFVKHGMAERGLSCVGCHMPPVKRRWADAEGVPAREGRSHALQTPRDSVFAASAFGLSFVAGDGEQRLCIQNQAGHQVPGLIGRRFAFTATLLAVDGSEVSSAAWTIDSTAFLPTDGAIELKLPGQGDSIRVVGWHHSPRQKEPVLFVTRELGHP